VTAGLDVGKDVLGHPACLQGIDGRPARFLCLRKMTGQGSSVYGPQLLQRLSSSSVQNPPAPIAQTTIHRHLDQLVAEAALGHLLHQEVPGDELVEGIDRLHLAPPCSLADLFEGERRTQDGPGFEDLPGHGAETPHPCFHQFSDRVWQGQVLQLG
jgi:hypothetical protein